MFTGSNNNDIYSISQLKRYSSFYFNPLGIGAEVVYNVR